MGYVAKPYDLCPGREPARSEIDLSLRRFILAFVFPLAYASVDAFVGAISANLLSLSKIGGAVLIIGLSTSAYAASSFFIWKRGILKRGHRIDL